ncbi:ATP-binding protein [Chryseobacterium luteum]|uniref:Histidine kinase/HSP90-like ATPase domain-containing protein n=1 Tax=Chryseobacterium luteum TaxID=421531 RepID=A0A085ZY38_9FLAO|nr:tetratricopeptide repeat-containing sensor histidine kinase [Chryseobacterium luteum]KFF09352.1 hypothetical protein IX38_02265 [Chryseobacterium luteum]
MVRYLLLFLLFIISCEKKTSINTVSEKADELYKAGEQQLPKNSIEAYAKFQQALQYYYKDKDSSNISKSLICQAIAQKQTGDVFGAETTLVEALNFMKDNDESLYSVYNTMGDLKYDQKEYATAEEWYTKALDQKIDEVEIKYSILNNKAASEYRQAKYSSALHTLEQIDLSQTKDVRKQGKVRENIVYTKWLQDRNYPAQAEFENLLAFKLKHNDMWGVNSSYSHLAEISQENNPSTSLYYAKQMLNTAGKIKSPEDRLEAIERISFVDSPTNAVKNFVLYKKLSDSIQKYKNANRNRFAYIKYDSEKKETENQRLKADQAQKENLLIRQQVALAASVIIIVLNIILYRRRQARLRQENELKLKNDQLRISKKVHDVVANGIYQVMTKIENQEDFNKDEALDELEFVYEKSRDISYDKEDSKDEQDFSEKISNSIGSFNNDIVKTYIAGNGKNIWENVSQLKQEEIYQIIRELLVNMKKHSKASLVSFRFERINNEITIHYKDNGIGIPGDVIYKNGLSNAVSRIEILQGQIIFDTETEKGLKIDISFPVY